MYLNCHSNFSLRYGTLPINKLVGKAVANGIDTLSLTDINNSMGVVDFVKECNKHGIKPIAGIEFRDGNELLYIGIARDNEGFMELNEFLSYHNINKLPLPQQAPEFSHSYVIILSVKSRHKNCAIMNTPVSEAQNLTGCFRRNTATGNINL